MGKRSRDKGKKKERRRAEAAALAEAAELAKSTWLAKAVGLRRSQAVGGRAAAGVPSASASVGRQATPDAAPPAGDAVSGPPALEPTLPGEPVVARTRGPSSDARLAAVDATELAARLAGLSTVLQREVARADTGDGLTRARLSALSLLVLGGPRTLGDLAAAEHVRPPTMTRLVHAMEADGLVSREPHPSDGRSIVIRATASGEAHLEHGRARQILSLAQALAGLDDAQRQQLEDAADLLGRVLRTSSRGVDDPSA